MAPQPQGTFSALAAKISAAAAIVDAHFAETGTPAPSFLPKSVNSLPYVPKVQAAKIELLDALEDLQLLTSGPADFFGIGIISNLKDASVLQALNDFKVWDAVPLDGTATYAEIAEKSGLSEDVITRILRFAMTRHIFASPSPGRVAHTSFSAFFLLDPLARSWIGHITCDEFAADAKFADALRKWPGSGEPNETAAALAFWPDRPDIKNWFEWADGDGEGDKKGYRVKRFGEGMKFVTGNPAFDFKATIHRLYDWASLGEGPFVDIGGSMGHISIELASTYPDLKCIVQDVPPLEGPFTAGLPSAVSSQVSFQPHDFFTPQPVAGAGVYFFKHILHDWSDPYATKILQQIVPVLTKPGARIFIMEGLLPDIGEAPTPVVRMMSALDMQMLVLLNARERTAKNWSKLLEGVDEKLELKQIHTAEGSAFALIEAGLKE